MKSRHCLLMHVVCALTWIGLTGPGLSQTYPARSVRIVIPITPGSVADVALRLIAQDLSDRLGSNVTVDNRPGGGGVIGSSECAKSVPDGSTLCLLVANALSFAPFTVPNLPYNPERDFRAVSNLFIVSQGLFAKPSLRAGTVAELRAMAVAAPNSLTYATLGMSNDIFRQWLNEKWNTRIVGVPYKGGSEVVNSLVSESTDIGMMGVGNASNLIEERKLKILAVSAKQRSELLPDTPTYAEAGLGEFNDSPIFWGMVVPAGAPDSVVTRLHSELVRIVRGPKFADFAKKQYLEIEGSTPEEFQAFMKSDRENAGAMLKKYPPAQ